MEIKVRVISFLINSSSNDEMYISLGGENDSSNVEIGQQNENLTEESLIGSLDGLLIACKNHPTKVVLSLIKFLSPSRPFVVYCPFKVWTTFWLILSFNHKRNFCWGQEPLVEAYMELKDTGKAIMVALSETWCRNYQVNCINIKLCDVFFTFPVYFSRFYLNEHIQKWWCLEEGDTFSLV